jgi:hypothetical protein
MNRQECAKVLAKIQLGDNRQVDQLVLEEWFDTIGHLDYEHAIAGVRLHRQESAAWLMPAHVIAGAYRSRESRLPARREVEASSCRHVFKGGWCVHCPTKEET